MIVSKTKTERLHAVDDSYYENRQRQPDLKSRYDAAMAVACIAVLQRLADIGYCANPATLKSAFDTYQSFQALSFQVEEALQALEAEV